MVLLLVAVALLACSAGGSAEEAKMTEEPGTPAPTEMVATFGGGCFWCTEALFERVDGVLGVTSGYSGGTVENPTYQEVCSGETGHAEVIQVRYAPARISYTDILEIFFKTHDPTTLNRQGADVGTQYRSAIFVHDDEQRKTAEKVRAELDRAGIWPNPIVTEIVAFEKFWPAESYHQDYYAANAGAPYCQAVIAPKIEKLEKVFRDKLKK